MLGRIGFRFFRGLVRWSRDSAPKRVAAAALGAAVLGGLAWAWWPDPGTHRPIQPDERGTLTALLQPAQHVRPAAAPAVADEPGGTSPATSTGAPQAGAAAERVLSGGQPLVAAFEKGEPLPTRDDPALALVLVPTEDADGAGTAPSQDPGDGSGGAHEDVWVFPFDKPLPPSEGDNQALAVATADGSVTYDVAFAVVWADGDEVLKVNEAHAYASCTDCVAVAVAFQVVLVMDDARVVVPQNLAVAANYDCYECITAAIASQLVLSVTGEPGEQQLRALGEVWNELVRFAEGITSRSITEIIATLEAVKAEIVEILADAPLVEPTPVPAGSPSPSTEGAPPPTEAPSSDPSPPASEPSTSTPAPTPEPTQEPAPAPEPTAEQPTSTPETTTPEPSSPEPTGEESSPTQESAPAQEPAASTEPAPTGSTSP